MGRRVACLLLAVLMMAGCASSRSHGSGSGTPGASPSPAGGDDSLVRIYNIPRRDITKLGMALNAVPPGHGRLAGPSFTFQVTRLGTAGELTESQLLVLLPWPASPRAVKPEPDHELLVLEIEASGLVTSTDVDVVFHVGDRTVRESVVGTVLIIEAPKGQPVDIDVTTAGRIQKMDLRTGRTSDLIDGYYPLRSATAVVDCSIRITQPGIKLEYTANVFSVQTTVTATLLPHLDGKGWAPAGRRWLRAEVATRLTAFDQNLTVKVDLATDLTLIGPAGRFPMNGVASLGGTVTGTENQQSFDAVYDVTAGTASLSVVFSFSGAVLYKGQPVRWVGERSAPAGGIRPCRTPAALKL